MEGKWNIFTAATFFTLVLKVLFVRQQIIGEIHVPGVLAEISLLFLLIVLIAAAAGKWANFLLFAVNLLISVVSLTAIIYFDYYNSIITYKALGQADQLGDVGDSIAALFTYRYLLLFADVLVLPFLMKRRASFRLKRWVLAGVLVLAGVFVANGVRNARGTLSEISQFNQLGLVGFQLMEGLSGMRAAFRGDVEVTPEMVAEQQRDRVRGGAAFAGVAKGKNVIVVQLESVQDFLVNKSVAGKEITPNLNRLASDGVYFPNFYTQVGKGNTSDAEFIANTSVYALGDTPMSAAVAGKEVRGLPMVLSEAGYHTATFHANDVSFWNREEMYESLDFKEFYDKSYFGSEDFIAYGTSDEIFYEKSMVKLREFRDQGRPFYVNLIALSSHFPYELPEEKKQLVVGLPEEFDGSIVGKYIQSVNYADYALGKLVEQLKADGLYEESVMVVYGDHQGLQTQNDHDKELVRKLLGREYHGLLDHLNVPLVLRVPGVAGGKVVEMTGGLVDIYPTLANLLDLDLGREVVFGTDLMNAKENLIGVRFYAPTGTYLDSKYGFSPGETRDSGELTAIVDRTTKPANQAALKQLDWILQYLSLSDEYVNGLE
ncbi:LTA synthase family protein [Bacillus sp. FJAT-27251]|uniref:LTA synthase family protein n=1 Tax=Bacillus sp. FJAT-27251 TaxID=1684142 RepID=UPI0006A7B585|nr:LTA synthase family protein [Bacillus sp. FJAT-27251]